MSKRTDVYVTAAYQHASCTTLDTDSHLITAKASIGSYGYSGNDSETMVNLGLRHRF